MRKNEQQWVDWFKEAYVERTRAARKSGKELGPVDKRVVWDLVEEKGIELKIINTNTPSWYPELERRWQKVFPKNWCHEFDRGPSPTPAPVSYKWDYYKGGWVVG